MQTNWKITANSVILEGLLVMGALFDGYLLSPCISNTESINPIPNCYITWIHKVFTNYLKKTGLSKKINIFRKMQ